jgi:uncharacterized DUF497 family protein
MIDWQLVTGFEWDDGNARKSVTKHDVSQTEAEQLFFNEPLLMVSDFKHSTEETRIHALGKSDEGRKLHATFTLRQSKTKIRIISARDMSKKERKHYEK